MIPESNTIHGTLMYFFSPDDVIAKINGFRHTQSPEHTEVGVDFMGDSTAHWVESPCGRAVLLSHPHEYHLELYAPYGDNEYGDVEFVLKRGIHDSTWSGSSIPNLDTPDLVQRFMYLTNIFYSN